MIRSIYCAILLSLVMLCMGCSRREPQYIIGVSQCSQDIWRDKLNDELRMGTYLNRNVELRFACADDSDERQVEQIDSLVASGIDLLIVAPNQTTIVSPAIDRVYDSGIPVVVFDRKTNSHKYTAYIGADNEEMGRQVGEYIATQLKGHGRVLEVKGLKNSSPAIERHRGFTDALSRYPGIELVGALQGDWTEQSAVNAVSAWLSQSPSPSTPHPSREIDFVFGQNDRMAVGVSKVFASRHLSPNARFCGIDGLPGKDNGIECVIDSVLEASYIYPTHGDQVLQLAVDILDKKPYQKENLLMAAMVTRDNARVLQLQNEETARQSAYLDRLHHLSDSYLQQLDTQRTVNVLAVGTVALLLVVIVLFYLYHIDKITLRQERVVNNLWNINPEDIPQTPEPEPATATEEAAPQPEAGVQSESVAASLFIARFREVVEAHLTDSEMGVEDLAAGMNLSRVQLYRKVKAITGSSPVELLRTARLRRAYQLLVTTDKSVSEVAYEVGFTAPSYFTKCFKEEYGQLPGDIRKI